VGRGSGRGGTEGEESRPGGAEPGLRLLLACLLGVLLGALLVTLIFMTGRFGEIPSYVISGFAAIGAGHVVGLVAGRREVTVASLSTVVGVLLVALIFFQQSLYMQGSLGSSNPVTLIFLCMPLAVLAAGGGWLAELARERSLWSEMGRADSPLALSPRILIGIAVAILLVVGLLMLSAGIFEESPSEALETAFRAANEGDYDTADEYLTPQMTRELDGDTRNFWDSATEGGSITEINSQVEDQQGGSASVQIFLQYETGGSSGIVVPMTRQDGKWKILPQ
jgi:hypothetical protein